MIHSIDSTKIFDVYDHNLWQMGAFSHVKGHIMHYKVWYLGISLDTNFVTLTT